MLDFLTLALVAAVAIVGLMVLERHRRRSRLPYRRLPAYEQHRALFTPAERSFFGVLEQAVGNRYRIFAKVRVADILKVSKSVPRSSWQAAFNKINSKHFDFVLCDVMTLEVLLVLELNDSSHRSEKRARRDEFLRSACTDAGLRLVEFPAKRGYSVAEVAELLNPPDPPQDPSRREPYIGS